MLVQVPNAASRYSYGSGPSLVLPTSLPSSARSRCGPIVTAWRRPEELFTTTILDMLVPPKLRYSENWKTPTLLTRMSSHTPTAPLRRGVPHPRLLACPPGRQWLCRHHRRSASLRVRQRRVCLTNYRRLTGRSARALLRWLLQCPWMGP